MEEITKLYEFFNAQPKHMRAWKLYMGSKEAKHINSMPLIAQSYDDVHPTKEEAAEHLKNTLQFLTEPGGYTLQVKDEEKSKDAVTMIVNVRPQNAYGIGSRMPQIPQPFTGTIPGNMIPREYIHKDEVNTMLENAKKEWQKEQRHKQQMDALAQQIDDLRKEKKAAKGDVIGQIFDRLQSLGLDGPIKDAISGLLQSKQQGGSRVAIAGFDNETAVPPAPAAKEADNNQQAPNEEAYAQLIDNTFERFHALTGNPYATFDMLADMAAWAEDNKTLFETLVVGTVKDYRKKNGKL